MPYNFSTFHDSVRKLVFWSSNIFELFKYFKGTIYSLLKWHGRLLLQD